MKTVSINKIPEHKTIGRIEKLNRIQAGRKLGERLGSPRCTIADAAREMGISRAAASKLEAIALYKLELAFRELAKQTTPDMVLE